MLHPPAPLLLVLRVQSRREGGHKRLHFGGFVRGRGGRGTKESGGGLGGRGAPIARALVPGEAFDAVGVAEGVERVFAGAGIWGDVGDHDGAGIAHKAVTQDLRQFATCKERYCRFRMSAFGKKSARTTIRELPTKLSRRPSVILLSAGRR